MAAAFSLLLCGCSKEDAYHQDDADNAIGTVLSLQVNAAAYQSSTGTRATDAELTTTFTSGDRLGVIITHQGGSTEHIVYTYNGSAWTSSAPFYYDPQDTYAAYYPYKESLQGKKSLAEVKSAFTPLTDQSDYSTGYAASDLMTCESATPNTTNKTLSITLTHAFSMLRMPGIPVKIKCGDSNTYEYSIPGTDIAFHIGDTPYRAWVDGDGYARLIVSNSGSDIAVKSCYTFQGKRAETSCTISSFASGQYYTVAPPPRADLGEYQLSNARVGDFYIKSSDGQSGFVFPKEASLPESLKSSCLGIVLKVGKDNDNDWKDDCQYKKKDGSTAMSTINGYVLALYDANSGSYCQWGSYGIKVDPTDMNRDQNTGFYGYKNTQAIISFNAGKSGTLSSAFPATYHATEGYEASHSAPANSSGWFLPSAGQCKYWLNNKETLLESVRKATGNSGYSWNSHYWSSSEYSYSPAYYAWFAGFNGSYVDRDYKNYNYYVRSYLAF